MGALIGAKLKLRSCAAFTLMEALVGVGIAGFSFIALYAGLTQGFGTVLTAREMVDATQTLEERFETARLYTWDEINSNGFIPATFTVPFPDAPSNSVMNYTGRVIIADAPISEAYSNDLKLLTVELVWMSQNRL